MAKRAVNKDMRKAVKEARGLIQDVARMDGNEAETRRRLERIFEIVMGYDTLKHLTRERAVKGAGATEHVDFAIHLDGSPDAKPVIMVEIKRVSMDLALKHLKQVTSYAIDTGCEWVLLTNGRQWRVYHIEFGQPPETKLLEQWDIIHDDIDVLADKFGFIGYKSVKSGGLDTLWRKTKVLEPGSLLTAMFSEAALKAMRSTLRKGTGLPIDYEDIISRIRRMLNEAAAKEMDELNICVPARRPRPRRKSEAASTPTIGKTQDAETPNMATETTTEAEG